VNTVVNRTSAKEAGVRIKGADLLVQDLFPQVLVGTSGAFPRQIGFNNSEVRVSKNN
jgi:hypothetical protein